MSPRKAVIIGATCLALAACEATFRNHGYIPLDRELENVIVGVDTRDTVSETIGQPSSAGLLTDSGYYYVRSRWRHYTYRAPEEIDRQVLAISFDEAGVVTNIERFGLEDGQVVALSRRVTDANTKGVGFIRQLLGNIGNFNAADFLNN